MKDLESIKSSKIYFLECRVQRNRVIKYNRKKRKIKMAELKGAELTSPQNTPSCGVILNEICLETDRQTPVQPRL